MTKLKPKQKERLILLLKRFMEDEDLNELNFQSTEKSEMDCGRHTYWNVYMVELQ